MVIEKLERRQLLSTTASVDVHGVLVIQLDNTGGNVNFNEFANGSTNTADDSVQVFDPTLPNGGQAFFFGVTGIKVLGGAGNDLIIANHVENVPVTLAGGGGDDTIVAAYDVVQPGIDTFGSGSLIDGGDGNNVLGEGGMSNSTILGGSGSDSILATAFVLNNTFVGGNNMTVRGGGGDDIIQSGLTNSTLDGGTGNDIIADVGSDNFINGGAGVDTISATINDFVVPAHGDVVTRV